MRETDGNAGCYFGLANDRSTRNGPCTWINRIRRFPLYLSFSRPRDDLKPGRYSEFKQHARARGSRDCFDSKLRFNNKRRDRTIASYRDLSSGCSIRRRITTKMNAASLNVRDKNCHSLMIIAQRAGSDGSFPAFYCLAQRSDPSAVVVAISD